MSALESAVITANTQLWKTDSYPFTNDRVASRLAAGELVRIFGPCSITSTEQVLAMMKVIAGQVDLVRAPGKKPRTRPVTPKGELLFEGIGMKQAAEIMREVIAKYPQTLFASEIMEAGDLDPVSTALGLAWIGSRTIQQATCREIGAKALEAQVPVMVKNPMVPELELMLGMMENTILGSKMAVPTLLCLRGFMTVTESEKNLWRYASNLYLIPKLLAEFPDLPIIIDPSHMLPKHRLRPTEVADLVEAGVQLGAKGYIVELHTPEHPSKTDPGTDAEQTLNLFAKRGLL